MLYNRTYPERLARWRADGSGPDGGPNTLMGPTVVDVDGAKRLMEASGALAACWIFLGGGGWVRWRWFFCVVLRVVWGGVGWWWRRGQAFGGYGKKLGGANYHQAITTKAPTKQPQLKQPTKTTTHHQHVHNHHQNNQPTPSFKKNQKDFVGVSGYAPLTRPLSFSALEISWETAAYEFGLFGISIKELMAAGKKLIYA